MRAGRRSRAPGDPRGRRLYDRHDAARLRGGPARRRRTGRASRCGRGDEEPAAVESADERLTPLDALFLQRAYELAARGIGSSAPNPPVGAVVVRDGRVVGEGFHRRAGGPHAEAEALAAAGPQARGATLYVSLEPCKHVGRTPPCTQALLRGGHRARRRRHARPQRARRRSGALKIARRRRCRNERCGRTRAHREFRASEHEPPAIRRAQDGDVARRRRRRPPRRARTVDRRLTRRRTCAICAGHAMR